MESLKRFCVGHPIIVAIVTFIVGYAVLQLIGMFITGWPYFSSQALVRIIMFALMVLLGALVAGPKIFAPRKRMIGYTFRKCWWIIALAAIPSVLTLLLSAIVEKGVVPDWFARVVGALVLCLFIGLFEESMFRGVIFNALLSRMGGTRRGIVWAAIITSVVFGFAHIMVSVLSGQVNDISTAVQAIGKTISTAMFAFLLSAVYLKTRNILGVALIHGINDFLSTVTTALFTSGAVSTNYVHANGPLSGLPGVIFFVVYIALSIPFLVVGWHVIRGIKTPQTGFFGNPDWASTASESLPNGGKAVAGR
ncbi:MAG: CPBP family intramembrane metalloprotease [Coriobacteriales bacterium]|nr:CPBP family intramembrane metalloprotease [Coriobacteriales bacterium]